MQYTRRHEGVMPAELRELYQAQEGRVELNDEIALIDGRISQLMLQITEGASNPKRAIAAYLELLQAYRNEEWDRLDTLINQVGQILMQAGNEAEVWREINLMIDLRRRLVVDESARAARSDQLITVEEMQETVQRLMAAIELHVADPVTIKKIGASFKRQMIDALASKTAAMPTRVKTKKLAATSSS